MPLNPAASTTAGQFAASMLVSRTASSGPAAALKVVPADALGVVPAAVLAFAFAPTAVLGLAPAFAFFPAAALAAADVVPAMLPGLAGCAVASGRNANMRSKVISKPMRGSGAMFKS